MMQFLKDGFRGMWRGVGFVIPMLGAMALGGFLAHLAGIPVAAGMMSGWVLTMVVVAFGFAADQERTRREWGERQ